MSGIWLGVFALLVACGAYHPRAADRPSFLARVRTETQGTVRVSVAALGASESREHFGIDLKAQGIQPVWLEIDNRGANWDGTPSRSGKRTTFAVAHTA